MNWHKVTGMGRDLCNTLRVIKRDHNSIALPTMRLIEKQMNRAILERKDWKLANTEVIYSPERDASYVMLHGHHIATIGDTFIEMYSCGYRTNTTKSRLSAILKEHGNDARIYQKDYQWFVYDNGQEVPFTEGMILV